MQDCNFQQMSFMLKKLYQKLELYRYRILARDGILSQIYYLFILLFYPLISIKPILNSKLVNHRNRNKELLNEQINNYEKYPEFKDKRKDMIICYLRYHILPWEYVLYNFANQSHKERMKWLSDTDRYMCCELIMGAEPYLCLKDKNNFYKLAKKYFKRGLMPIDSNINEKELEAFINKYPKIFVKPLSGSLGRDTFILDCNEIGVSAAKEKLISLDGAWMLEEAITQSAETASWNSSSVNTIRIPSFRREEKTCIVQPFFRTGRKGEIVDNAGAGGILAVVNSMSGVIETDGFDESRNSYSCHPDSGLTYKGYQIPYYEELVRLSSEIHKTLPGSFKYVAFDFALTANGWDLIEGNWGQMIGQIASKKGIKQEFDYWLGIIK